MEFYLVLLFFNKQYGDLPSFSVTKVRCVRWVKNSPDASERQAIDVDIDRTEIVNAGV